MVPWLFALTVKLFGRQFRSLHVLLISTTYYYTSIALFFFKKKIWSILKNFQDYLNVKFKETGHSNMYFPQVHVFIILFF